METGALIATFTCDAAANCCAFITDDKLMADRAGNHMHFVRLEAPKYKNLLPRRSAAPGL